MNRAVAGLAIVLASVGVADADDCKPAQVVRAEKELQGFFRAIDSVGTSALGLLAKCMYRGSDDAGLARLAKAVKALKWPSDASTSCLKTNIDPAGVMHTVGQAMGMRVGLAYAACSSKAQAKIAELEAKKLDREAIKKEIGEMAGRWIAEIVPN